MQSETTPTIVWIVAALVAGLVVGYAAGAELGWEFVGGASGSEATSAAETEDEALTNPFADTDTSMNPFEDGYQNPFEDVDNPFQ